MFPLAIFLLAAAPAAAQADPLAAWHGDWRGTCALAPPFRGVDRFEASLLVQPHGLAGRYKWRLIYEANTATPRMVRNYEMHAVDAARGHYVLDEKNGLRLDSFVSGRAIYTNFVIGGSAIPSLYLLLSDTELLLDLPNFEAKPARRTCLTSDANTCVDSYRLVSSQRCRLRKAGP